MAFTVWIEGVERTSLTFLPGGGNLRYSLTTRTVGAASLSLFSVDNGAGAYRPAIGDTLAVKIGGVDLYTGAILELEEKGFTEVESGWDKGVLLALTISDQNRLPGYALYSRTYAAGTTLKAILQDLVAVKLAAYGITLDAAQATGPTLSTELAVLDTPVDTLLTTIQTLTGWVWRLSPALVLSMIQPGVVSSGITLQDSDTDIIGGVSFRLSRLANYANRVTLKFSGDAGTASAIFPATANFANGETVTIASKAYTFQTVLTNVDGHVQIGATAEDSQGNLAAAITLAGGAGSAYAASTTVHPSVTGYMRIRESLPEIAAMALTPGAAGNSIAVSDTAANAAWIGQGNIPLSTLQGGWDQGLSNSTTCEDAAALAADGYPIERIYSDANQTNLASAQIECAALLRRALLAGSPVVSVTHRRGIAVPGLTVTLSFAEHAVSGVHMIVSVDVSDDVDGEPIYTFSCVAGSEMPDTWVDYFRDGGGSSSGSSGGVIGGGWVNDTAPIAASRITSGLLALAVGGTHADLSATGGTAKVLKQLTVGGDITVATLTAAEMPVGIPAPNISTGIVSNTEFDYLDGATSNIQAQIDVRVPTAKRRYAGWYLFHPANQAPDAVGLPSVTTGGTMADGSDADHSATAFSTSSNGIVLGVQPNAALSLFQSRHDPKLFVRLRTGSDITDLRLFVGLCNGQFSSDNPAADHVGVRFSTSAGDTKFVGVTSTGAAQSVTAGIGSNVAASTWYEIEVVMSGDGTLATFTINGTSTTSVSNLPTTTDAMNPRAQGTNLAAEAKAITLSGFYVESD